MDVRIYQIPVGAGFACPNASTNRAVDVFGRADPAPTDKWKSRVLLAGFPFPYTCIRLCNQFHLPMQPIKFYIPARGMYVPAGGIYVPARGIYVPANVKLTLAYKNNDPNPKEKKRVSIFKSCRKLKCTNSVPYVHKYQEEL